MFIKDRTVKEFWWFADMEILLTCILEDGLLARADGMRQQGGLIQKCYRLTENGQEYIAQWPVT